MSRLARLDADALWSAVRAAAAGSRAGVAGVVAERCVAAGSTRLGWAEPPPSREVHRSVAAIRAALGLPVAATLAEPPGAEVVLLGTGGWSFAARALVEATGPGGGLAPLDSLDRAAIEGVLTAGAGAPRAVLAVSGSGATLETQRLVDAVPPRGGGRLVWLRDEGAPPDAFALSPRGAPDQVAMLGAPLSTAFLTAAAIVDSAVLADAYPRFLDRCHQLGAEAARRATAVPLEGAARIRFVVPHWAGPGLRRWLLQLGRQVLGGKSGASGRFRPMVEVVPADPPRDANAGAPPGDGVAFDLGGLRRDLPALLDGLYAAGVFVACVGLRAGLDVADHTNVRAYKERLAHTDPDHRFGSPVAATDLPAAAAAWLARQPELARLHVVGYWSGAEESLPPAAHFAAATGRPCEVHEGSAWNHHSFQAVYPDPAVAVLIVTRGAGTDAGAAAPVRAAARTLRQIAAATHRSLPGRSVLVPIKDPPADQGPRHPERRSNRVPAPLIGGKSAPLGAHPRGPAAVLFDVDGVLLDTGELFREVWRRWAAARALDPERVLARTAGRRTADVLAEVAPHLDPAVERRALDALTRERIVEVRPVPGAARLLRACRRVPCAIVTSGSRWFVGECFQSAGLPLPAVAVYDEDVRRGKPSPEGYFIAARRLGVDPGRCVVVEDAPDGVRAAKDAGCTVLAVTTTHTPAQLAAADACAPTLAAVRDLLWTARDQTVRSTRARGRGEDG